MVVQDKLKDKVKKIQEEREKSPDTIKVSHPQDTEDK